MARTDQPNAADDLTPGDTRLPQRSADLNVLAQRLKLLPPSHPSSPDYEALRAADADTQQAAEAASGDDRHADPDPRRPPDAPPGGADKAGPPKLTDDHTVRAPWIREKLADARREGLASDSQYLDDDAIWSPERRDAHSAIVNDLYEAASDAPCGRKAIMAGGLGGAGKSTVLDTYAGIDQSQYLRINPDDIKEEFAKRGLIPELDGLSPMEASDLVHEESSHVAKLLALRAMADGKNLIWDITMSSSNSVCSRLDSLDCSYSA